jgi:oligoendopeptidase F
MDFKEVTILENPVRNYLPAGFDFDEWKDIEQYFKDLLNREINSADELEKWLLDKSELESFLNENIAWRYINYTRNTEDKEIKAKYLFYVEEIKPKLIPIAHKLDEKLVASQYIDKLDQEKYFVYIREVKKDIKLFTEKNIPLQVEIDKESRKFAEISGAMTVMLNGKEYTLPQAAVFLKDTDRQVREETWKKVAGRRMQEKEQLDELFSQLVSLRHKVSLNAGFTNFRDYMHVNMGRFDYTIDDAYQFHDSVAREIVPIVNEFAQRRKDELKLATLRPWDMEVDITGKPALKPFKSGEELIDKTIETFKKLHPFLGNCLRIMKELGYLDLESRKGKAPGGYNYPLDEIGVPFIFMNAAGTLRDLKTMVHEGGHAVHTFLTRDLPLNAFKHTPSEVAELASMSMELISMDYWDIFFDNEDDLKRAKRDQLEGVLDVLPWVATVDKFQHWIYTHPEHSRADRAIAWEEIYSSFAIPAIDWSGIEDIRKFSWQRQLHIYEVPFYYIEYGIAQLGAIAVWKSYKENPEKGLQNYMNALALGYSRPVPEIYEAAGIKFDFSANYIRELAQFIKREMDNL